MCFICPICKSEEYKDQMSCIDYTTSGELFSIVSCKDCGLWQTYPKPAIQEIQKYYDSAEYISHSDKKKSLFDRIYHIVREYTLIQKIALVKKFVPRGTILDYGCGTGYFLEKCKKNGFDVLGVEPNAWARELAVKKSLTVKESEKDYVRDGTQVEMMSLWHVLEHLHHPEEFVDRAYGILKDKGYLLLALPNRLSYDAAYYGTYWAGYDVPRHLFHFTTKDVLNLTRAKFELKQIYPMYFDSFYVSILSEKYKKNKCAFIKGLFVGSISNFKAYKNNQYSSLIYVLQKI